MKWGLEMLLGPRENILNFYIAVVSFSLFFDTWNWFFCKWLCRKKILKFISGKMPGVTLVSALVGGYLPTQFTCKSCCAMWTMLFICASIRQSLKRSVTHHIGASDDEIGLIDRQTELGILRGISSNTVHWSVLWPYIQMPLACRTN